MVDSSDFETDVGTMDVYARGADPVYVTAPSSSQQEEGVKPLDRLPAQWWNWFLHEATNRFSNYKSYISNALAELDNLLGLSAITPDDTKTNQLKGMFENDYLQKYLPEVVSDASTFAVDASKESSILVSNDDGSNGFDVKKVPYSPCLIYNSQSISTVKTITLPANSPYDGQAFKLVFKNGHNCADASTPMTLNGKPVLVNVNGTLSALPIHTMTEGGGTVYKSLQSNTVLDIYYNANYDGNNNDAFVIIGNPVVLSSSDYTIYADGQNPGERINGTVISATITQDNSDYKVGEITLPAGVWLVYVAGYSPFPMGIPNNGSFIKIGSGYWENQVSCVPSVINGSVRVSLSAEETLDINLRYIGGATLPITTVTNFRVYAIRIV